MVQSFERFATVRVCEVMAGGLTPAAGRVAELEGIAERSCFSYLIKTAVILGFHTIESTDYNLNCWPS